MVTLYDWPLESVEEFKRLAVSEVTVCGAVSLLIHVTFVPGFTTIIAGLNEKFSIVMVTLCVAGVLGLFETVGVGEGGGGGTGNGWGDVGVVYGLFSDGVWRGLLLNTI